MIRQMRQQRVEYLLLDLLALGGRLDDQVAGAERLERLLGRDAAEGGLHRLLRDLFAAHLPLHVLGNRGDGLLQGVGADIVEPDIVARERHHMRDAVAHLARAHYPDRSDVH